MSIERSRDPDRFSTFELAGWNENIEGYNAGFGEVARQTVAPMLDAAHAAAGTKVLDVCCGPGMLAAGAVARGAQATGLDFSQAAVALASRLVPGCRFQQGDVQALPFANASFDAVVCGYGLMHLPEPGRALGEMLRVLRPGARAAVSVWDLTGTGFALVYDAVRACGSLDVGLPHGPDFFQFGSPERMTAALTEAGFIDVSARSLAQVWRIADADQYIRSILTGTVRARAVLAAQAGASAAQVRSFIADYLARFRNTDGKLELPMPAIIGTGMRAAT
jgi:SAM-dependent methyltransferase